MSKKTTGNNVRRTFSTSPVVTPEREARRRKLASMTDAEIDYSDIPAIAKDAQWTRAVDSDTKQLVTIRLDQSVIDYFKRKGPGYQTRINAVLRQYMRAHA